MSKIIIISILSTLLFACSGTPPKLEHPVKVYNGAPEVGEHGAICRTKREVLIEKLKASAGQTLTVQFAEEIAAQVYATDEMECIDAKDERMKQFGCMVWEDHAVIQRYIETLVYKCDKWKE